MLKTWLAKSPSNARFIEAAERKKELFEYKKTVETKAKENMRQALQPISIYRTTVSVPPKALLTSD